METGELLSPGQRRRVEQALETTVAETGLAWSVFVGDLSGEHRETCEKLHAAVPGNPDDVVLLVVSPGQRLVEVVTGEQARRRVTDRAAGLAVMSMRTSFEGGDLTGGILGGLRMLSESAGVRSAHDGDAVTPPRSVVGRLLGTS